MFLFGGLYADLDMEALKPQDPLLARRQVLLAWMGPPDAAFQHNIPNAWMASEPGHPLWLMMLFHIAQAGACARWGGRGGGGGGGGGGGKGG
jgi:mannosyltransferase OCH1-like enzyme